MQRRIRQSFTVILFLFLCIGGGSCQMFEAMHDWAFDDDHLLKCSADELKTTLVTSVNDVPHAADTNVLWCGSFQLAWNEVAKLTGGQVRFEAESPEIVALNRKSFDGSQLDDASYVALAGFVGDGIFEKISARLEEKFHGAARPTNLPPSGGRPQDIASYAYLFKNLEFATPYQRGESPIQIAGKSIACFGMGTVRDTEPSLAMAEQTSILDYRDPENFVVELLTKSAGDRLILAKIAPHATLAETIADVQKRVAGARPTGADPRDVLIVPKMNFDILKKFDSLTGRRLVSTAPGIARDLQLQSASQATRFQLDEKGVRLKSESHMSLACSAPPGPEHIMIFDKPFLLLLQRSGSTSPYFALWIANAELLVPAE